MVLAAILAAILNLGMLHPLDNISIIRNRFLIPPNPTLDTKIIVLYAMITKIWHKIGSDGHYGSHLEFGMLQLHEIIFSVINESLAPQNPTLDTKIMVLGGIVIEIWYKIGSGSHLGGHLEF